MEICSKSLRIGNIAFYRVEDELDERKEWNEINIIDAEDILSLEDYESKKQNHPYSPIPLTEEWLENFGFENEKIGGMIFTDYKRVDSSFKVLFVGGNIGIWQIAFEKHNLQVYIKYVHQLQNLFFILTDQELKYQPTKQTS